jgi:hypothetical protein
MVLDKLIQTGRVEIKKTKSMILSIYSLKTYHNFFYYFASICNASSSS